MGQVAEEPGKQLENLRKNPVTTIANAFSQFASGGLVGMNEDGTIGAGISTQAIDETVGEVTGRNQQRKALMQAKDAVDREAEARERDRLWNLQKREGADRQASGFAGSRTRRARTSGASSTGGAGPTEDELNTAFLGL